MTKPKVVVGVLMYNNNEVFLARSHKWNNLWIVPGGHLEWGESLHDCAKRS